MSTPLAVAVPPPCLRFLVVDDSDADRGACRKALAAAPWPFELVEAASLHGARENLFAHSYDCVLLSRRLPDGDGTELLPTLRALPSAPAVVLITTQSREDSGVVAIRAGAQDCVSKDRLAGDLLRSVRFALERKNQADELRRANVELENLAQHDPLTRLLNRRGFEVRLAIEQWRMRRLGTPMHVLIVDIDRFKQINDTLGHEAGDVVLESVARQLEAAGRATDHCARIGGDEFAMLLPGTSQIEARNIAERLRMLVHGVQCAAAQGPASGSLSVAVGDVPTEAHTVSDLLRHVDFALAQAKQAGGDRVTMAVVGARTGAPLGNRALEDLRVHLAEESVAIAKNSIVDLRTGATVARELRPLRRRKPEVSERAFYAAALNDGRLVELDLMQTRRCIELAEVLQSIVPIHVGAFCDTVLSDRFEELALLLTDAMRHSQLVLSLTSSLLPLESAPLVHRIDRLQRAGIRVELVDVGSDGEALGAITALRPAYVRLSAELLANAVTSKERGLRYQRLAHQLAAAGYVVIADGVREVRQREFVVATGIHLAIGLAA